MINCSRRPLARAAPRPRPLSFATLCNRLDAQHNQRHAAGILFDEVKHERLCRRRGRRGRRRRRRRTRRHGLISGRARRLSAAPLLIAPALRRRQWLVSWLVFGRVEGRGEAKLVQRVRVPAVAVARLGLAPTVPVGRAVPDQLVGPAKLVQRCVCVCVFVLFDSTGPVRWVSSGLGREMCHSCASSGFGAGGARKSSCNQADHHVLGRRAGDRAAGWPLERRPAPPLTNLGRWQRDVHQTSRCDLMDLSCEPAT